MATIKPFKALLPKPVLTAQVASVPYDVVSTKEARVLAANNPHSFLRIIRSEIELPDHANPYADEVYQRARDNLQAFLRDGVLVEEPAEFLYIYQLRMDSHSQTGIVGCVSLDEYEKGLIKIHEKTRPEKVEDRMRHMLATSAHCEAVFLAFKSEPGLTALIRTETEQSPLYDFATPDGIVHRLWRVRETLQAQDLFSKIPCTYIADGHHRVASAAACRKALNKTSRSEKEGASFFTAVLFSHDELRILPYNRVTRCAPRTSNLVQALSRDYQVAKTENPSPKTKGQVCMFWENTWHSLTPQGSINAGDAVSALDVSVLQTRVLEPLFGIGDPRLDKNIDFVGGMRGTGELERLVKSGEACCAFSMYPVSMDELFEIADAGQTMAPKSTWFEPKLRSGLFVHTF